MISKDTILSEVLDWEKILDGGYVTWAMVQKGEETNIQKQLAKTVSQFIGDFRGLVAELCGFDHERVDRPRYFYLCPYFWRNVSCGHPRVIRAKFKIARILLLSKWTITRERCQNYRDQVYRYTEPLTGADFRATFGYREEHENWWIQPDSPTGQKMGAFQKDFGTKLLALRDEIAGKLEAVFLH